MRVPVYWANKSGSGSGGARRGAAGPVLSSGEERVKPLIRSPLTVPQTKAVEMQGLGQVATAINDVSARMVEARRQEEANAALLQITEQFEAANKELTDPKYYGMSTEEHEKWFDERSQGIKAEVVDNFTDSKVKRYVSNEYGKDSLRYKSKARKLGWDRQVDRSRKSTYIDMNTFSDKIINTNNAGDMTNPAGIELKLQQDFNDIADYESKAKASLNGAVAVGALTPAEAEKVLEDFMDKSTRGLWERRLEQDALLFYPLIENPGKEPISFNGISEAAEDQIRAYGKRMYNQAVNEKQTEIIGDSLIAAKQNPTAAWESVKKETPEEWTRWLDKKQIATLRNGIEAIYKNQVAEYKTNLIGDLYSASDDAPEETWKQFKKEKPPGWGLLNQREKQQAKKYLMMNAEREKDKAEWISPVEKKRLDRTITDALVEAEYTGVVNEAVDNAIDAVYAGKGKKNEAMGQAVKEDYADRAETAATAFGARKQVRDKSLLDTSAYVDTLHPSKNKGDRSTAEIEYKAAMDELRVKVTGLSKDPFSYVQNTFKITDVDANLAKQRQQGLLEHQLAAMSTTTAKGIVGRLNTANGAEVVRMFQTLEQQYGNNWTYALRDLSNQKLDRSFQLLTALDQPEHAILRQQVGEALKMSDADLKKVLGENAKTAIPALKLTLDEELFDFEKSVIDGGDTEARNDLILGIKEGLIKSAIHNSKDRGDDISKIAKDLADEVINSRYNYLEFNDATIRIPVEYDKKAIESYIVDTMVNLRDKYIVTPGNSIGMTPVESKSTYVRSLKENGQFVTNENSTGLIFLNEIGNIVKRKMPGDITREYRVSFRDAETAGKVMVQSKPEDAYKINPVDIRQASPEFMKQFETDGGK